jgi:hypothetical protein
LESVQKDSDKIPDEIEQKSATVRKRPR